MSDDLFSDDLDGLAVSVAELLSLPTMAGGFGLSSLLMCGMIRRLMPLGMGGGFPSLTRPELVAAMRCDEMDGRYALLTLQVCGLVRYADQSRDCRLLVLHPAGMRAFVADRSAKVYERGEWQ